MISLDIAIRKVAESIADLSRRVRRLEVQAFASTGTGGGGAPSNAAYVLNVANASLTNSSVLDDGDGIDVTVAGGLSTVAVDATVARNNWAVTAGNGLSGGGNLAAAGITLNTGEGPGIDITADAVGLGGDTILIYDDGGSPIAEFSASDAGIQAAIAAAAAGNVIVLPAVNITATVALTIPANVTVKGMSVQRSGTSAAGSTLSCTTDVGNTFINMTSAGSVLDTVRIHYDTTSGVGDGYRAIYQTDGLVINCSTECYNDALVAYAIGHWVEMASDDTVAAEYCGSLGVGTNSCSGDGYWVIKGTIISCYGYGSSDTGRGEGSRIGDGKLYNCVNFGVSAHGADYGSGIYVNTNSANNQIYGGRAVGTNYDLNIRGDNNSQATVYGLSYITVSGTVVYGRGDRAAYSVEDYHATDIEAAALTRHLPLPGAAGNIPQSNGANWTTVAGSSLSMFAPTARGDMIAADATPAWARLAFAGASGSVITRNATDPIWSTYYLAGTATYTYTFPDSGVGLSGGTVALATGLFGGQTIIGGTEVTDILSLQGTTGNGTLTSKAVRVLVGNNGGTEAVTILNNGRVGVGVSPSAKFHSYLTATDPATSFAFSNIYCDTTYTYTVDNDKTQNVTRFQANIFGAGNCTGELRSIAGFMFNYGSGNLDLVEGTAMAAGIEGTGGISQLNLFSCQTLGDGAGVINNVRGLNIGDLGAYNTPVTMSGIYMAPNVGVVGNNKYGIYISNISGAAVNNVAIITGRGLVKFGDQATITGWADKQQFVVNGFTTQTDPLAQFNDKVTGAGIHTLANWTALGSGSNSDGGAIAYQGTSSTDPAVAMGIDQWYWLSATHASRTVIRKFFAYDSVGAKLGLQIQSDGVSTNAITSVGGGAGLVTFSAAANYTLTVPATGIVALLATSNIFTATQKISATAADAVLYFYDGITFKGGVGYDFGSGFMSLFSSGDSANPALIVGSTSRIGIGITTAPSYMLQVTAPSGTNCLGVVVASGYVGAIMQFAITGVSNGFSANNDAANNLTYSMRTGTNTQGFYQDASGNIGTGTATLSASCHIARAADIQQMYVLGHTTQAVATPLVQFTRNNNNAGLCAMLGLTTYGSGANGDGGEILLNGRSSTTAAQAMGSLSWAWIDATHATRTANIIINTYTAATAVEGIRLTPTETVINDPGIATLDFRAESDTEANAIFLDSSADKLYLGGTTNGVTIDKGGELTLIGTATVWKDVNVAGVILSKPTSSAPGLDTFRDLTGTDTTIQTYAFAENEYLSGGFEIQHDYKEGSDIVFHVHWQGIAAPSGTDNVQWRITYILSRSGVTLAAATTIDSPDTAIDTQYRCYRSDFGAIVGTNIKIGDQFMFNLYRVAADGDAYAGEALIQTCGIHYEIDTIGSKTITTK